MGKRGHGTTAMTPTLVGLMACILSVACGSALAAAPLPDGRAWEMVSPLVKNGGEINGIDGVNPDGGLPEGGIVQSSSDGNSITYVSLLAFPDSKLNEPFGAPIASQYYSKRKIDSWLTENITALASSGTYTPAGAGAPYEAFSTDLVSGLMLNGLSPMENPPLVVGAPERYRNYYLRDNNKGEFTRALLTKAPPEEPAEFFVELLAVTPDLAHAIIETTAALTPGASKNEEGNLYEWTGGQLWPVNVLPEAVNPEETAPGEAQLGSRHNESRTVSSDGSRVFWTQAYGGGSKLFVRSHVGIQAETVQVDATQQGPDAGGEGLFQTASSDGSKVFFTDRNRLIPEATANGRRHEDLYMFDVVTRHLTDLTVDSENPGEESALGVLEASEDGSYIYFVANGSLAPGVVASADNLYVWHEGTTKFIGAVSSEDNSHADFHEPIFAHDWAASIGERTVRLSPDGQHLVFMSDAKLTNYDNRDANTEQPDEEVYLYDAGSTRLTCISCNPSGSRPHGPSGIPGGTPWRTVARLYPQLGMYQSRVLSEGGNRIFFDSKDALMPQDSNGAQDIYEWEQDGVGTCRLAGGCVFLLSSGTSVGDSAFVDASADGSDVFFVTRSQLVGQDTDQLRDLYDARAPHVSGETVAFPAPSPAQPCEGESCLPPASIGSGLGALASTTFSGTGNIAPVTPNSPVKKRSKPKKHTRRHRKRSKKAGVKVVRGSRRMGRS